MVSQKKTPWKDSEGVFTASEGSFQVKKHVERAPRRDVKTLRDPFKGCFSATRPTATSLTIHSVLMYYVDAAVRPAVPDLFGNK